ncbi:MAG: glutamate--tRNA ligase [Spirochaetales bacterium]|nr:glutamate--tRNA ligase [Spirochaetales bacterium]
MSVRVRYAPSPTGLQHIGGVRTALFTYFFARSCGGTFILRIEDTDRERFYEEALRDIYDTFSWLGIEWDEGPDKGGAYGPYFQSERKDLYREYAEKLVEKGTAYRCYCTQERLAALRETQSSLGGETGYDRHCRSLSVEERSEYEEQHIDSVIRLAVPAEGETRFHDELLGDISRRNSEINPDPVLLKSDGFPTYHLANVVDDHLMKITHVFRAQEYIPSVPLYTIMYDALGWEEPKYCHLPMVMGPDGHKLSKRHGSTSIREFREKGYLPEAIINYVTLLGWSYDGVREFFSLGELKKLFSIEKLNKASATFDYKKLEWFNGNYIRKKSHEEMKSLLMPYLTGEKLVGDPPTREEMKVIDGMIPLVHERLKVLSEITGLVGFLFREVEISDYRQLIPKRLDREKTMLVLKENLRLLEGFRERSDEENENRFREAASGCGVKLGDFLLPLRISITGSTVSPPLFESLRLLKSEVASGRVEKALHMIEAAGEKE